MADDDVVQDDVVVVGRLGGPYGVQGWVHVHSFTVPPANVLGYQPWLLKPKGGRWQPVSEIQCRKHKKGFIAQIESTADRDAAAKLSGHLLGVPAHVLPEIADSDEFYWRELTGCEVLDTAGKRLGKVDHLIETGANDVLVLVDEAGKQILIPFVDEYVQTVDLATKTITVDWDNQW